MFVRKVYNIHVMFYIEKKIKYTTYRNERQQPNEMNFQINISNIVECFFCSINI